jgi:hypothetical protein
MIFVRPLESQEIRLYRQKTTDLLLKKGKVDAILSLRHHRKIYLSLGLNNLPLIDAFLLKQSLYTFQSLIQASRLFGRHLKILDIQVVQLKGVGLGLNQML